MDRGRKGLTVSGYYDRLKPGSRILTNSEKKKKKNKPVADFVHLHLHSQYSLLDGACRISSMVKLAKEYGMKSVAVTDHGNMFGAVEFYTEARKVGIKPIIGCEAYVAGKTRHERTPSTKYPDGGFHLVLLVRNETGYKNLMKLCSEAYREGFYWRPRIDKELLRKYSEGLIATTACLGGEVNWHLLRGNVEQALASAHEYNEIFGQGNFYLEIQNHGLEKQLTLIPKVEAISKETQIPMVVTNDCHYLRQEDAEAHDALLCIQTGKFLSDKDRMRYGTDQMFFRSGDEMEKLFPDYPEAIANTVRIAERCNFELEMGDLKLPVFPIPKEHRNEDSFLKHLCDEGMKQRYEKPTKEHIDRLDYELMIIKRMGYAGYFLITKDFCDYARSRKIPVGPGRGSAAGSIVSYLLRITNLDPIRFNLLFERFLNPERISMPDIDIDFADRGRDQIIRYVIEKYGEKNVCQIITFGTMAARAVVRDVGRVLSVAYSDVDKIAKMIPAEIGISIEQALEKVPELRDLVKTDPQIEKLIRYARTLEGLARHASTHAAGVVIAPGDLTQYVPLFRGSKGEITTQYDMKRVEQIGLLKMDFLGLRTLTVIDDAVKLIKERNRSFDVDIDNLPLDDAEVYKIFAAGDTIGIFQFESAGMRDYLRRLHPENFTDITAMNALYRPGPLDSGMIDKYIDRKKRGSEIKYAHPVLEAILHETYGIIVFQEQVLRLANELAGYSLGKADLLRKAMGKKDAKLMAQQKQEFLSGAEAKGIQPKTAVEIFDQIETFARYGFNRAHSTCYAFVAYQTAWLKVHYPREFMAALMTSEITDSDRIYKMMEECREMGIKILPPDVNSSRLNFSVVGDDIRFGLQAVKNVGESAARTIAESRARGKPFGSLADLVSNIPPGTVNRRTLESLIAAGACDSLEGFRSANYAVVETMLEFGQKVAEQSNTVDLFASASGVVDRVAPKLPAIDEWTQTDKLAKEKETLGFYVSGHPLDAFRTELKEFTTCSSEGLENARDGWEVTMGGIMKNVKKLTDKKGNLMAFVVLEDYAGGTEVIVFSKVFEAFKEYVADGVMVLVSGKISTRDGKAANLLANEIMPLEHLTERFNCQLVIKINESCTENKLERVLSLLEENQGPDPVLFSARQNGSEVFIRSKKYAVSANFDLLSRLKEIVGDSEAYLRPLGTKERNEKSIESPVT